MLEDFTIVGSPFWIIHPLPEKVPVQSAVAVSKRNFKRANKRNLLKRRMREAFRLNKQVLYSKIESLDIQIAVMIIFNHTKILSFNEIEPAMQKVFSKIIARIEAQGPNRGEGEK